MENAKKENKIYLESSGPPSEDERQDRNMALHLDRFPPSYPFHQYRIPTRPRVSGFASDEDQLREERKWELVRERNSSRPFNQFRDQANEERLRTRGASTTRNIPLTRHVLDLPVVTHEAAETIKNHWIEQGIWKNEWNTLNQPQGPWKHEEPIEPESPEDSDSEGEIHPFPFYEPGQPSRPIDSEDMRLEKYRTREASRPYNQFVYQVSKARELAEPRARGNEFVTRDPAGINTQAYEKVRGAWTRRGIWNDKWGVLPGMSWKHEHSLEEIFSDELTPE